MGGTSGDNRENPTGNDDLRFIVDINVGKLARWLRMMGYDTLLFGHDDDARLIKIALDQGRIVLTRDSQMMKRRVVTSGRLGAILLTSDQPEQQMGQVMDSLHLDGYHHPFRLCLECNQPLEERTKEEVTDRIPPYVFKTKEQFVECPACRRVYWKGTHWEAMTRRLQAFTERRRESEGKADAGEKEGS